MSEISFEKLQDLTGYEQPADIAAHLAREGVRFFRGKYGRPYTFEAMFTQAANDSDEQISAPQPLQIGSAQ